jgi:hypothetical protein
MQKTLYGECQICGVQGPARISSSGVKEDLRERILRLRNEAEYIRVILDTPPDCSLPSEPVLLDRIAAQRDRRVEDRRYVLASEVDGLGWHRPGIASSEATNDQ